MTNQGFIKFIILLIIAVIVLGFFGISLKSVFQKEAVKDNLGFVWSASSYVWNNYLSKPSKYLWNVFYNYMWLAFIDNLEHLKEGKTLPILDNQPQMQESAPTQ